MIDTKRLATDAAYWDSVAPEGATHYNVDVLLFYRVTPESILYSAPQPSGDAWCTSHVRVEEFGGVKYIPRPQAPEAEWVDGLPPVGCECDINMDLAEQGSVYLDPWRWCEVLAHRDECAIVWIPSVNKALKVCNRKAFRPLKTKAQRDRDELGKVVENALIEHERTCKDPIEYTSYDAVIDAILSRYNLEPKP